MYFGYRFYKLAQASYFYFKLKDLNGNNGHVALAKGFVNH